MSVVLTEMFKFSTHLLQKALLQAYNLILTSEPVLLEPSL